MKIYKDSKGNIEKMGEYTVAKVWRCGPWTQVVTDEAGDFWIVDGFGANVFLFKEEFKELLKTMKGIASELAE